MPIRTPSVTPSMTAFPARGKIIAMQDRAVVFAPAGKNYELRLDSKESLEGVRIGVMIEGLIRVSARQVWTVMSGGNFIEPIFGPPRKIQGRIRYLDEEQMVLHCGVPILVALPTDPSAFDLARGPLAVGASANVSVLPGGMFEMLAKTARAPS